MASTEKLPSGRFRGVYTDRTKKPARQRMPGTYRLRSDALYAAQEAEVTARRRAPSKQGTYDAAMTWCDWHAVWWPTRDIAETTERTETTMVQSLIMSVFGDRPLNDITTREIQAWLDKLRRRTSAAHARRAYSPLRASFKAATELGVLSADPCAGVVRPVVPKSGRRHMEADVVEAVRQHLAPLHRDVLDIILDTGMRPGEVCGLHREHVTRGWVKIALTLPSTTKTIKLPKDEDRRDIPLTTRAQKILDRWKAMPSVGWTCGMAHATGAGRCHSDLVFRQTSYKPLNPTTLQAALKRAGRAAGIEGVTVYSLRHSYGTKLAARHVDPWTIARLMGHATLEQATTYVHESEHMADTVRAALE